MPKVTGPLFSLKARGQFAKSLIFKRGGIVVNYFKPRNPNSEAQQAQRQAFKELYVSGLTQEQADLLYAAIAHLHDERYSQLEHEHDERYLQDAPNDGKQYARKSLAWYEISTPAGLREVLTTSRTYYVRKDGSDSNNGLSNNAAGSFLTIQKAINVAASLDMSIFDVTIQIGSGTYAEQIELKQCIGSGKVIILGDETTPANVIVSGANAFSSSGISTLYSIRGVKGTGSGNFILSSNGARVEFQNCDIANTGQQLRVQDNGSITATGNYKISAGGTIHWSFVGGGVIRVQGRTITLTGTPNFSSQFASGSAAAVCFATSNTYSGAATGTKYYCNSNAVLYTAGGGVPGTAGTGSTDTGGIYN